MKKIFLLIISIFIFFPLVSKSVPPINLTKNVTIIPIKGPIESALLYVVRRGIDSAIKNNSEAIIFHMNTPGGAVDAAGKIISIIGKTDIPTYTYIDNGAYSAGAFIALSAGPIYMSPGSVIGAATPMMMSPMGGVQEMPEEVKEKMTSAVAAMVRAAAEQGGHDPELAECMVRADLEYKVGRKIISEKGRLLTLTNSEAEQNGKFKKPLISNGTMPDIDSLISEIGIINPKKLIIEPTGSEKIARGIAKIAPILMLIGMGGLWLEFKTPGFGFFGLLGGICLLLFFLGHHIAGLSGMEDIILFLIGLSLIFIEIFITPGVGLLALSGVILMLLSLINAMVEQMPGSWKPISFEPEIFITPLLNVGIAFTGSLMLLILAGKFLPKTKFLSNIALGDQIKSQLDNNYEVGQAAITISQLRPSGSIIINGKKVDAFTRGEFIEENQSVKIISIKGSRIIVKAT